MLHCFSDGGGYSFSGSWLHLVSMRLEYRMRVYLLIVVVLTLYTGEVENSQMNSNIRFQASRAFVNHRIRENRLAVYLRLLAGLP